jgi:transcriptional regulator with XRE-family HTH domain
MAFQLSQIGERLRAYRLGAGLSIDEMARRLNLSRASTYRLEKVGVNSIDTLERVARLLGVSVASLLGVDVEYIVNAVTYFERLRQIEHAADWIFVAFGPISYLLTSRGYDRALQQALYDQVPAGVLDQAQRHEVIQQVMEILERRKADYQSRRPAIMNVLSAADIERFAQHGLASGERTLPPDHEQRRAAIIELKLIADMLRRPPLGVQIGILFDTLPTTGFNLMRRPEGTILSVSPFRLGPHLNIRKGVAMITTAPQGTKLYGEVANDMWEQAVTGTRAADYIVSQIEGAERNG